MGDELNESQSQEAESHAKEDVKHEDEGSMLEAIEQGLGLDQEQAEDQGGEANEEEAPDGTEDAALKKAGDEPASPKDDEDLSMPDGLSTKAQDRFRKLTGRLQETSQALRGATEELDQFRRVVQSSMATPQEFSQAIEYMRMVKSGDLDGALRVLDEQRRRIALATGRVVPGTDPLAEFPDLRARVDQFQMDEQAALELARSRALIQEIQRQQEMSSATMQRQHAAQSERAQAIAEIDKLGAQWAQADPDFSAKEDVILKRIPEIAKSFPPSLWASQVRLLYDTLSAMPAPATSKVALKTPLRSSGKSGGSKQPESMLEALTTGLGYGID